MVMSGTDSIQIFDGGNVFLHCVAPMLLVPDSAPNLFS